MPRKVKSSSGHAVNDEPTPRATSRQPQSTVPEAAEFPLRGEVHDGAMEQHRDGEAAIRGGMAAHAREVVPLRGEQQLQAGRWWITSDAICTEAWSLPMMPNSP